MSTETSNAPREVWVRLNERDGPCRVTPFEREAPREPYRQERYVRADLAVPSADEIGRGIYDAQNDDGPPYDELGIEKAEWREGGEVVREFLLSRIEGADDGH